MIVGLKIAIVIVVVIVVVFMLARSMKARSSIIKDGLPMLFGSPGYKGSDTLLNELRTRSNDLFVARGENMDTTLIMSSNIMSQDSAPMLFARVRVGQSLAVSLISVSQNFEYIVPVPFVSTTGTAPISASCTAISNSVFAFAVTDRAQRIFVFAIDVTTGQIVMNPVNVPGRANKIVVEAADTPNMLYLVCMNDENRVYKCMFNTSAKKATEWRNVLGKDELAVVDAFSLMIEDKKMKIALYRDGKMHVLVFNGAVDPLFDRVVAITAKQYAVAVNSNGTIFRAFAADGKIVNRTSVGAENV
jgi:hypothetical protein